MLLAVPSPFNIDERRTTTAPITTHDVTPKVLERFRFYQTILAEFVQKAGVFHVQMLWSIAIPTHPLMLFGIVHVLDVLVSCVADGGEEWGKHI